MLQNVHVALVLNRIPDRTRLLFFNLNLIIVLILFFWSMSIMDMVMAVVMTRFEIAKETNIGTAAADNAADLRGDNNQYPIPPMPCFDISNRLKDSMTCTLSSSYSTVCIAKAKANAKFIHSTKLSPASQSKMKTKAAVKIHRNS